MTSSLRVGLFLTVAWGVATCAAVAWADKNGKGLADDIKRQEKEVAEARKKVNGAKQELDAARAAAQKAQQALEKATDKAGDVRRAVQDEHDSAPSLVAARKKIETARADLERLTAPLLERLRQDAAYRTAVAERDQAKARLAALPSAASPVERDPVAKQYSDGIQAVRRLEKAAIDADAPAKTARQAVDDSEAAGKRLIEQRDRAIEQDSRLQAARKELDEAKSKAAQAKQRAESEARQLAGAQKQLHAEEDRKRDLERKRQQQNNKNKNKK